MYEKRISPFLLAESSDSLNLSHSDDTRDVGAGRCYGENLYEVIRRLATTQKLARIGDWEYDVATGDIQWSSAVLNLLGISTMNRRPTFDEFIFNYAPGDSERLGKALLDTIKYNDTKEIKATIYPLEGRQVSHRHVFIPIAGPDGVVTRVNGYLQVLEYPIPGASGSIPAGRSTRFIAVDTSAVVFRVSLPDGAFEFISPAIREVTGHDMGQWQGNPQLIREILPPGWKGKFDREFKKVLRGKAAETHEFPILHTSGETRWILLRTTIVREDHGEIIALEGIASDITGRKREEGERKRLIRNLRRALTEVKTLSGLLPICSHCKKVRDDQGYWRQIDAFITEHSDLFFSHGLCPECLIRHYPEYNVRKPGGKPPPSPSRSVKNVEDD